VDDARVPAVIQKYGAASVCCVITHDVTVIVAARHVALDHVVISRITDVAPLKRERAPVVELYLADKPDPSPPHGP
jgi:hypothetical protein